MTTHLQATSTAARIGLTVCMCAGWGDVGFVDHWTFEIENRSPYPLRIPVGATLAQVVFHEVAVPERDYQKGGGQYHADQPFDPKRMLPKRLKVQKPAPQQIPKSLWQRKSIPISGRTDGFRVKAWTDGKQPGAVFIESDMQQYTVSLSHFLDVYEPVLSESTPSNVWEEKDTGTLVTLVDTRSECFQIRNLQDGTDRNIYNFDFFAQYRRIL